MIQETAYMVGVVQGSSAESAFLRAVGAGAFAIEDATLSDVARAAELVERYADLPLGYVDAAIVAIAERLDIGTLLTTDRRHFTVVRPAHRPGLILAP